MVNGRWSVLGLVTLKHCNCSILIIVDTEPLYNFSMFDILSAVSPTINFAHLYFAPTTINVLSRMLHNGGLFLQDFWVLLVVIVNYANFIYERVGTKNILGQFTTNNSGAAYGGLPQKVVRCCSIFSSLLAKPKSPRST